MEKIVYHNDYYVMPRIQSVEYDNDNPRIEICIIPQTNSERTKALQLTK